MILLRAMWFPSKMAPGASAAVASVAAGVTASVSVAVRAVVIGSGARAAAASAAAHVVVIGVADQYVKHKRERREWVNTTPAYIKVLTKSSFTAGIKYHSFIILVTWEPECPYNSIKIKRGEEGNMYNDYYNSTGNMPMNNAYMQRQVYPSSTATDFGPNPFVVDINKATLHNNTFRTALWTGNHLQLTLMSIAVGEDIGLEMHPNVDQFLRIEDGHGFVQMGDSKDHLYIRQPVFDNYAIFVPAGTWHNLTNMANKPLKLYSIYAPPNHPWGTIHQTKAIAEAAE